MEQTDAFNALRPRLYGIAYRMLGARADAEDIVQDAYLRWHDGDAQVLRSAEAWLVTVVTRLCIDRLRSAKTEREAYSGLWLPEPLVAPIGDTPEAAAELASDISTAFLLLLERLAPDERAVFLLHQVFDVDYPEIAATVGKSEAACRQMLHRARERVQRDKPRFTVDRADHIALLEKFAAAARTGDRVQVAALLDAAAVMASDGGGKVIATLKPLHGPDRIARLYYAIFRQAGERSTFKVALINGEPGLLRLVDGKLDSTLSCSIVNGRIAAIYAVRNPDKLIGIEI